jgi:predicted metal-dependent phosphoesterase TrpH
VDIKKTPPKIGIYLIWVIIALKIDLHIHTKTGSDGNLSIEEVFHEAISRNIGFLSITDHDSIDYQPRAILLARESDISYVTGVELNITFNYPETGASVSLDCLGYCYNHKNQALRDKLKAARTHREWRAGKILEKLNVEFDKEGIPRFTWQDMKNIQDSVDSAFGRPHIANYLIQKGIVKDKQEAFDKYLVKCDVPKYPLTLDEASTLLRDAGGILVLAHPSDPHGTSLTTITQDLAQQTKIIEKYMLEYIQGIECWHSASDKSTSDYYVGFASRHKLIMTGGSDCHQKPIIMGTVDVPDWVAKQFN